LTLIGHGEKVLFMRVFITLLVLIFSIQSWSKADDITEFEIERMRIGDSLLDHYSKNIINNKIVYPYNSKKMGVWITPDNIPLEKYDGIQVHLKKNDLNFLIKGISGHIYFFNDDINKCYPLKKKIVNDVRKLFKNSKEYSGKVKHHLDKSGKTTVDQNYFQLSSGGSIFIECYDWSEDMPYGDKLSLSIRSVELSDFVENDL